MTVISYNMRLFGLLPRGVDSGQRQFRWNLLLGARSNSDINNTENIAPMVATETIQNAIENFKKDPKANGDIIQYLEVIDETGGLDKAFVVVFDNDAEARYLRTQLGELAKVGLIVAIPG